MINNSKDKNRSFSPHYPKGKEQKIPILSKHASQQFAGGCIQVYCRIKPLQQPHMLKYQLDNRSVSYVDHEGVNKSTENVFVFSDLFKDKIQQEVISSICDPILQNKQFGALLFAYGVTNSGKTYTTIGTKQEPGILYYLLTHLKKPLKISAFEVYNECYYTLDAQRRKLQQLCFLPKFEFKNFCSKLITERNISQVLDDAIAFRTTDSSHSNPTSSRSHAVFKIQTYQGRTITVVDLAGSQKFFEGENSKDGCLINKSLLTLGRCLKSLNEQKEDLSKTIPFRESKLTKCLAEYFTTQYKLYMIVTVNPSEACFNETRKVLEYSALAREIKYLNEPKLHHSQNDQQSIKAQLEQRRVRENTEVCLQYEVEYEEYIKYIERKIQYEKEEGLKRLDVIRKSIKRREEQIINGEQNAVLSEEQVREIYDLVLSDVRIQFSEHEKKVLELINIEESKWNEYQNIMSENKKRKQEVIKNATKDHQMKMNKLQAAIALQKQKIEKMRQTQNTLKQAIRKQNKSPLNKTWSEKTIKQKFVHVCLSPFKAGREAMMMGGSALKAGVNIIKNAANRVSPFKNKQNSRY